MYSEDFIAKVKANTDIVAVVSETVQLKRSGKASWGSPPFTKEKTPSFHVHPDRQSFHCFSTGQGGDVFSYLMLTRGLNFPEAVAAAAEKAGIPLEETNKSPEQIERERRAAEEKKIYLKLNQYAARFFQEQLEGAVGAVARDYVQKRGITKESELAFALGYAPDSWTALRDYFLKIKAPMVKACELGLFRSRNGEKPKEDGSNLFDFYRNRLMFPIRDPQGQVVDSGRWLGPSGTDSPKYLNSADSPVYEKDKILYNVDQAKKSIRELETTVLVEGYMDCLALVQAGFPNVVANCGTALTRTQVGVLRKLSPKVICLYDSDEAGQKAMEKRWIFPEAEGVPLLGAHLPEGKDPDEFLRAHGEEGRLRMAEILQESPALIDEWIERQVRESPKTLQARTDTLQKVAAKLSKLRDDLAIQARLPGLAKSLELEPDLLIEAVRKFKKGFLPNHARPGSARVSSSGGGPNARTLPPNSPAHIQKGGRIQGGNGKRDFGFQRRFFSDLLRYPQWIESLRKMQAENPGVVLPYVDDGGIQQALLKVLEPLQPNETDADRISGLLDVFREQPEVRNLITESTMKMDDALPEKELDAALRRLKDEALKKRAAELQQKIAEAESRGDAAASESLLLELMELRRQRAH